MINTQEEIVELVEKMKGCIIKDTSWKKYYGDVCCRIFREFLLKEIPKKYTISCPNAYIVRFPTELDLLILDSNTNPEKYTNAFKVENVTCELEIKAHGLFGERVDLEKKLKRLN